MTYEDNTSFPRDFNFSEYELCKNHSMIPLCSLNSTEGEEEINNESFIEYIVPIVFGLVVIFALFGNTLVVIVIIGNRQMRSTTNYLIFSLAVADLLFIIFCVPFTAIDYTLPSWPFGEVWCKMVQYLTYVTASASVFTLLLLSLDRYFAVVHPIHAMSIRTERNAVYAIIATWTIILICCIPLYIAHGISIEEHDGLLYHLCTFRNDTYDRKTFQISFILIIFFMPAIVIVFLYVRILHRLWHRGRPGGGGCRPDNNRSKKRATKLAIIIVVTFMICWLPIQMILLLRSLGLYKMTNVGIFMQVAAQVLAYMNSCLNPILYAFFSDPFRKAFRKVMHCSTNSPRRGRPPTNGKTLSNLTSKRKEDKTILASPMKAISDFNNKNTVQTELQNIKEPAEGTNLYNSASYKTTEFQNLVSDVYCGPIAASNNETALAGNQNAVQAGSRKKSSSGISENQFSEFVSKSAEENGLKSSTPVDAAISKRAKFGPLPVVPPRKMKISKSMSEPQPTFVSDSNGTSRDKRISLCATEANNSLLGGLAQAYLEEDPLIASTVNDASNNTSSSDL